MKKDDAEQDKLRPEYDLRSLRTRKLGRKRGRFGDVVRLDTDVARAFPTSDSVNDALRLLIRIAREKAG